MKSQAYPESLNVAASTSGSQNLPLDIREVVYNFIATINSSASPINIDAQAEGSYKPAGCAMILSTSKKSKEPSCFSEAEYARYFGDLEQVDLVLEGPNMEKSDVEIVEHLLDQGFSIMSVMEKSRQRSLESGRSSITGNVTPDALATNDRDDENPQ
ncbi:hypothetical protein PGTUg99_009124 [Puccinia graminis f. sp. tritici]|uniref:Uncharacterized protein n=1 Tax=Puccinia graminis f. sp. tritici TaxID=56615 RepID=A0A5B0PSX0_PUCGR|nr:hypothetical protein PGTUg99_009124 [Puccinia graminis f. sp. tritici]